MFTDYDKQFRDSLNAFQERIVEVVIDIGKRLLVGIIDIKASGIDLCTDSKKNEVSILISSNVSDAYARLYLSENDVVLFLSGWHEQFSLKDIKQSEIEEEISQLLSSFLEGNIKIVETMKKGIPYKWELFLREGGEWVWKSTTSTAVISSFTGKKTRREFLFQEKDIGGRK